MTENNLQLRTTEMFGEVQTDIYENDSQEMFMTIEQLGRCLGYSGKNSIKSLISRNPYLRDEEFSRVVILCNPLDNSVTGQSTRVFNEDGIYEVTLLANTNKAKEFHRWIRNLLKSLRRGDVNLITRVEYTLLQNQIIEATTLITNLEKRLTPTKPDYWRWKSSISTPLIKQIADKLGIEKREAFDLVYDTMSERYGFDRSFAINQMCCKYGTAEEYVIDAIADNSEYQRWFFETATSLLNITESPAPVQAVPCPADKVHSAILPLIKKYNDRSVNGARTYGKVYARMTSKLGWEMLLKRNKCHNKKELLNKREDRFKQFCKCIDEMMSE